MPKRKLTDKLKQFLYENRWRVKQSDYDGDALAYLLRLRRASKAAKKRKENTAKIGNVVIPRNSELYEVIEESAVQKGVTIRQFIRKHKKDIEEFMQDGRIPITRETSYAISDIERLPKLSKIYINGQEVSKGDAIYALQSFTSSAMQHTNTVVMNYELSYSLTGDLYIEMPSEEEIEEAEEMADAGEEDYYYEMMQEHDEIIPIISEGNGKKK